MEEPGVTRRRCLALLGSLTAAGALSAREPDSGDDWTCPMDPQIHLDAPGKCPLCGMTLVRHVPDRSEFPLQILVEPAAIRPGDEVSITLAILDPNGLPARKFNIVHEKLMHLFLVNEDLQYFAHVHPKPQPNGTFQLSIELPEPGMYRLLADYFPTGGAPQLSVNTLYVSGKPHEGHLEVSTSPQTAKNLEASLRMEPATPVAGLLTRLFYDLTPADGIEPYLGAMAHMLVASEDLIDLIHLHPSIAGNSTAQFDLIFPRPGAYRIWTQFQRKSIVNTVVFTVGVKDL